MNKFGALLIAAALLGVACALEANRLESVPSAAVMAAMQRSAKPASKRPPRHHTHRSGRDKAMAAIQRSAKPAGKPRPSLRKPHPKPASYIQSAGSHQHGAVRTYKSGGMPTLAQRKAAGKVGTKEGAKQTPAARRAAEKSSAYVPHVHGKPSAH
eukprot:Selendium_serpulae@DN3761_c0_g1_i1.p1